MCSAFSVVDVFEYKCLPSLFMILSNLPVSRFTFGWGKLRKTTYFNTFNTF